MRFGAASKKYWIRLIQILRLSIKLPVAQAAFQTYPGRQARPMIQKLSSQKLSKYIFHLLFYGVLDSREHTYQTHHFLHKAETYFDCLHKRILRTYKSLYCCDVSVLGATGIK